MALVKVSGAATAGGAGAALYFGMTPDEWSVIGIITGIAIGVLGLIANVGLTWYFKAQHLKIARVAAKANENE
jgi:hypothetical protein